MRKLAQLLAPSPAVRAIGQLSAARSVPTQQVQAKLAPVLSDDARATVLHHRPYRRRAQPSAARSEFDQLIIFQRKRTIMSTQYIMQRDTGSWRLQVWASFGIALIAAGAGVIQLPGAELDRAFLTIGFFFCLFASFAVAKTVRDNRDGQVDTASWVMTVWVAFAASVTLTAWGLYRMNIPSWQKSYMLVSWLFLVSSAFTLAKTLRDAHEAELMERQGPAAVAGRTEQA